jgi:hypothetical protein
MEWEAASGCEREFARHPPQRESLAKFASVAAGKGSFDSATASFREAVAALKMTMPWEANHEMDVQKENRAGWPGFSVERMLLHPGTA